MDKETLAGSGAVKALDAVVDEAIAAKKIVGTVVMVEVAGRRIYERAAGLADREAKTPVKPDTIFRWASLTKPAMAVLTMALIEKGVVTLDDRVSQHLPDFRPKLADGEEPMITVRHLLTHTAGLAYRFFEPPGGPYAQADVSDGLDTPGRTMEDNLQRIASVPLAYPPGSAWAYSVAYDVLGAVLAAASGKSLPDLMREYVTSPLGMGDSAFVVSARDRLAVAYADGSPEPIKMGEHHLVPFGPGAISYAPDRMFDPASFPSGGAGMSGTAGDFMAMLEAMRKGGAPVLSPHSVQLLSTVATGDLRILMPGSGFSLGWAIVVDPAAAGTSLSAGAWRWSGVYGNSWFVDPAKGVSAVILTNTALGGMGLFAEAIRDALYLALPA